VETSHDLINEIRCTTPSNQDLEKNGIILFLKILIFFCFLYFF